MIKLLSRRRACREGVVAMDGCENGRLRDRVVIFDCNYTVPSSSPSLYQLNPITREIRFRPGERKKNMDT